MQEVKVSTELSQLLELQKAKKGFLNELIEKLNKYDNSGFLVRIVKFIAIRALKFAIQKIQQELNQLGNEITTKFIAEIQPKKGKTYKLKSDYENIKNS